MVSRKAQNISYKEFLISSTKDISSNKLEIGQFQRNYVWVGKHIKSLIDSIDDNDEKFYLGNIIIQRNTRGSSGRDYVVDGQQRMVTLSLLVKAMSDSLTIKEVKDSCERILFYDHGEPRIKFARPNLNRAYRSILYGSPFPNPSDENQLRILRSFTKIKKELKSIDDIEILFKKLLSLEFVVIKCDSAHNVHQLFESLNSKGQKLSPVELIKNFLLSESKSNQTILSRANRKWEDIEKLFEEKESRIVWFGKFLRHYWFSVGGYVSERNLFERIRAYVMKNGVESFSTDLSEYSNIYVSLRRGDILKKDFSKYMSDVAWKKVEYLISYIRELGLDQVYAVLLALFKYGKNNPEYFKKDRFFKDVEKLWCFLILAKYSKVSPSSYEKVFADFCFDINNKQNFKSIKNSFFEKLKTKAPNKSNFVEVLNERIKCTGDLAKGVDYKNHSGVIRTILLMYLSDGDEVLGDFTIEHIIPKGNLSNWKTISPAKIADVKDVQRYKLGNLTLLKNDKVENECFDIKYSLGYKVSRFEKNKKLIEYSSGFNSTNPASAVKKRGENIAADLYDICIRKLIH